MPDAHFAVPRLAGVLDAFDPVRGDLDPYVAIVEEHGAETLLDIGCGTGDLACRLARRGVDVVGVDPAPASLEVARRKPGAADVRWLVGEATSVPPMQVDMVTMTGNVAQVFLSDGAWHVVLAAALASLRPGGRLVFESRDPTKRAWRSWTREQTWRRVDVPGAGTVERWVDLMEVALPLVSFRTTFVFASDSAVLTSDSTLRFRDRREIVASLGDVGLTVEDVRDAPDRPGLEMVFVAGASGPST